MRGVRCRAVCHIHVAVGWAVAGLVAGCAVGSGRCLQAYRIGGMGVLSSFAFRSFGQRGFDGHQPKVGAWTDGDCPSSFGFVGIRSNKGEDYLVVPVASAMNFVHGARKVCEEVFFFKFMSRCEFGNSVEGLMFPCCDADQGVAVVPFVLQHSSEVPKSMGD